MTIHSDMPPGPEIFAGRDVLITGGLGFIGSALARRLVALSARVTLVDSLIPEYGGNPFNVHDIRDRVTINVADVRDPHAMAWLVQGRDYLFNLAGQTSHLDSMADPLTDLNINTAAQLYILEACRRHNPGVKIVFASTRQIYGRPQYLPVDEKHPLQPVDVNGVNKLAGESYHLLYNDIYGIRATVLRLTNTYGPGMRVKDARQTFLGVWIRLPARRQADSRLRHGRAAPRFQFHRRRRGRAAARGSGSGFGRANLQSGSQRACDAARAGGDAGRVASGRALRDRAVPGRS